jgi:hypothetical protein
MAVRVGGGMERGGVELPSGVLREDPRRAWKILCGLIVGFLDDAIAAPVCR